MTMKRMTMKRMFLLAAALTTALLAPVCTVRLPNGQDVLCGMDLNPHCIPVVTSGTPGAFKPAPTR